MDKDAAPRQVGEPAPDPNNNSPHPLTPHTPKLPLPAPPGFKVQTSPHLLPNQQMDSLSLPAPPAPTPTQRLRGSSGVTSAPLSCAMGHKRRRQRPSSAYSNRSGIGDKKKKKKRQPYSGRRESRLQYDAEGETCRARTRNGAAVRAGRGCLLVSCRCSTGLA